MKCRDVKVPLDLNVGEIARLGVHTSPRALL